MQDNDRWEALLFECQSLWLYWDRGSDQIKQDDVEEAIREEK